MHNTIILIITNLPTLNQHRYRECLAEMEISADLQRTNYLREKAKSKDGDETEDIGFKLLEQRKKALLDDAAAVDVGE